MSDSKALPAPREKCPHLTKAGKPCALPALPGRDACMMHDPESAAKHGKSISAANLRRLETDGNRCTAKTAGTGRRCLRAAAAGQKVCTWHGALTPQAKRKAAERIAEENARKELVKLGAPVVPVANALEKLREVAGEVLAFKSVCAGVLDELKTADWRYASEQQLEQIRGEVIVFERALDRSVATLSALARVQVDERLAAIEEAKAEMIARAFTAALVAAGFTGDAAGVARAEFARGLRVLPAIGA